MQHCREKWISTAGYEAIAMLAAEGKKETDQGKAEIKQVQEWCSAIICWLGK